MYLAEKRIMTFKQDWEKTKQPIALNKATIRAMIKMAFPTDQLNSYKMIDGGCANLNIKINLAGNNQSFILRIYLRDKQAVYREKNLGTLLNQCVPIPQVYFIDSCENYRFAITEFIPGITLRDLLLSNKPHDVSDLMFDAGQLLSNIQSHHFTAAGFFDNELNISELTSKDNYIDFAHQCLKHATVIQCLTISVTENIKGIIEKLNAFLPDDAENHLVHGDFDPANILVNKIDNQWKISGILDWEFAFSGSPLFDVANMLRYAHQMPAVFETSFIQGVSTGFTPPQHWKITTLLLNIISLLDCLTRCPIEQRPNQCADISLLISYMIHQLESCDE